MRDRLIMIDGTIWRVWEVIPKPGSSTVSASLVFESEQVVRRVRRYPAGWARLDDAALFALSERT